MIPTPSALSQTDTFAIANAHYANLVHGLATKASQGLAFYVQRASVGVETSADLLVLSLVLSTEASAKALKTRLSPGEKGQRKRMAHRRNRLQHPEI